MPRQTMPRGIDRWPSPPCHVTDPCEGLHTASPPLIQVGLIQRMTLSCLGSTGPLLYTWRGETDLQTAFLTVTTDLPACNHHPEAIHHRWMVRRCNGWSADRGQCHPVAKSPQTASSSPTSTPMPSTHYKRGYGAWWRSPLSSSQAFQVFQALRSSPRVVA